MGAAAGAVGVWILTQLLKFMLKQEANVNFSTDDALFQQGKVYLTIPENGQGLVNVEVKGRHREFKARTLDKLELPTGTPVEVVELSSDGTVVVQKVNI